MEEHNFETDTKALGKALFIFIIAGSVLGVIITGILIASHYTQDDALIIANALGIVAVEIFILQHYTKKLHYQIPLHMPKDTLQWSSYAKYVIVILGLFWGSSYIFDYLTSFVSNYLVFSTPDFTPSGATVTNLINMGYGIIIAPVFEELIMRGLLLGKLKQYGTVFAIVTVSVIFGLFHGNLPQGIPAFCMSIGACMLTIKAGSVLPAISVHIIANAVGYLSMFVAGTSAGTILDYAVYAIIFLGIALAIYYIMKHPIQRLKDEQHHVMEFFNGWGGIAFLIISILDIIFTITIVF